MPKELDLSKNDLWDSGVELILGGLMNIHCKFVILWSAKTTNSFDCVLLLCPPSADLNHVILEKRSVKI